MATEDGPLLATRLTSGHLALAEWPGAASSTCSLDHEAKR
jgi:hypothetical protein